MTVTRGFGAARVALVGPIGDRHRLSADRSRQLASDPHCGGRSGQCPRTVAALCGIRCDDSSRSEIAQRGSTYLGARFSKLAVTVSTWFGVPMRLPMTRRSSANCSAAPALARRLNRALAPRTASGLRPAISAASAKASSRGVSRHVRRQPELAGLGAGDDAGGERQLLGHVDADEPGQEQRAGHVGHQAPADLAHRQLGVRVRRCGCRRRARSGCRRRGRGRGRRR